MNFGLVSIITPAYRAEDYISQTVSSVRSQSYSDWEMLIVDDCSPDRTYEVVEAFSRMDSRIRLMRQSQNSGPSAARSRALGEAKGRWIAFLDSDDLWLPSKLELQLDFHQKSGAVLTFTEFRRMSADGKRIGSKISVPESLTYRQLLGNTAIATSTVIVDSKLSGRFQMQQTYYDDFACWLELLRAGGEACGLREDLMRYRVVNRSVSRNKLRSAHEVWKLYRQLENLSLSAAGFYFISYALNGLQKYRRF